MRVPDDMSDRSDRYNTHAPPRLEAEGLPAEEGVEQAKLVEQLHTDPEKVPNRTDREPTDDDPGRDA